MTRDERLIRAGLDAAMRAIADLPAPDDEAVVEGFVLSERAIRAIDPAEILAKVGGADA